MTHQPAATSWCIDDHARRGPESEREAGRDCITGFPAGSLSWRLCRQCEVICLSPHPRSIHGREHRVHGVTEREKMASRDPDVANSCQEEKIKKNETWEVSEEMEMNFVNVSKSRATFCRGR